MLMKLSVDKRVKLVPDNVDIKPISKLFPTFFRHQPMVWQKQKTFSGSHTTHQIIFAPDKKKLTIFWGNLHKTEHRTTTQDRN